MQPILCAVMAATLGICSGSSLRALAGVATPSDNWVECAADFQACLGMPRGRDVWVRYGTATGRKYFRQARENAICSPSYFGGDPVRNVKKNCQFFNGAEDELWAGQEWEQVGKEQQLVNIPPGVYNLKYGPPNGPFLYTQVGVDDRASKYHCNFPDIAKNQVKYCFLSKEQIKGEGGEETEPLKWRLCATREGQNCVFNEYNEGGFLVRYGHGGATNPRFNYVKVIDPSSSLICSGRESFGGSDPVPNVEKYCEYIPLNKTFGGQVGSWRRIGSFLPAAGGGFFERMVTEGVERSTSETVTNEFSRTLTQSYSSGVTFMGVGAIGQELSIEVSQSIATAMQSSTAFTSTQTCLIHCDVAPNQPVFAWQWVMESTIHISPASIESFSTMSCDWACTDVDQPPPCSLRMTWNDTTNTCVPSDAASTPGRQYI